MSQSRLVFRRWAANANAVGEQFFTAAVAGSGDLKIVFRVFPRVKLTYVGYKFTCLAWGRERPKLSWHGCQSLSLAAHVFSFRLMLWSSPWPSPHGRAATISRLAVLAASRSNVVPRSSHALDHRPTKQRHVDSIATRYFAVATGHQYRQCSRPAPKRNCCAVLASPSLRRRAGLK